MIMARRLTLEGASVIGVYEPGQRPEGHLRNVVQCLNDFDIPLHFGHTVTRVSGSHRLKSVELYRVDKNRRPIAGSENRINCDSLIISVGLMPENELADILDVPVSKETNGPLCDQNNMTLIDGVFCCGNALHINNLADHISESGEIAGRAAARYMLRDRNLIEINTSKDFLYCVPKYLDYELLYGETAIYFRPRETRENAVVKVYVDGYEVHSGEFLNLRPQETERISVNFNAALNNGSKIELRMEKQSIKSTAPDDEPDTQPVIETVHIPQQTKDFDNDDDEPVSD